MIAKELQKRVVDVAVFVALAPCYMHLIYVTSQVCAQFLHHVTKEIE